MANKHVSVEAEQIEGFKIEARVGGHIAHIDQPVDSGGTDSGPSPLDYLFIAEASCIITIGQIIARQQQLPVHSINVKVEGDLDPEVFMGKNKEARAGFTGIQVIADIDADLTREEKEKFLAEIHARCPVSDNLMNATSLTFLVA